MAKRSSIEQKSASTISSYIHLSDSIKALEETTIDKNEKVVVPPAHRSDPQTHDPFHVAANRISGDLLDHTAYEKKLNDHQ